MTRRRYVGRHRPTGAHTYGLTFHGRPAGTVPPWWELRRAVRTVRPMRPISMRYVGR